MAHSYSSMQGCTTCLERSTTAAQNHREAQHIQIEIENIYFKKELQMSHALFFAVINYSGAPLSLCQTSDTLY